MSDYIVKKALEDVWCTPIMDSQVRIHMPRITPNQGVSGSFPMSLGQYMLPDTTSKWHVFKLGRLYIQRFGVSLAKLTWYPLSVLGNRNNIFMEVYNDAGLLYPRQDVYLMETENDNITVAVRRTIASHDFFDHSTAYYLRIYDNAFFRTERSNGNPRLVQITVPKNTTQAQRSTLIGLFTHMRALSGYVYALVNGYFVTEVNSFTIAIGDYVEFVYDSSVKRVVMVPVTDLNTFESTRDTMVKYILEHPALASDTIEYHDDVDLYLVKDQLSGFKGVKLHKNETSTMRNLTHCDYSLSADLIVQTAIKHTFLNSAESCFIAVIVRNSGYERPLVHEAGRIYEMKKMSFQDGSNAMAGLDSNVNVWLANNLERSYYPKVMNAPYGRVTKEEATLMYGYNGMAYTLANTPQNVPVDRVVSLPEGLANLSTVYEFAANGDLIDFYNHSGSPNYIVRNANCVFIEGIMGQGSDTLGQNVDMISGEYNPNINTRFYRANKISGVPTGPFEEVLPGSQLNLSEDSYTWLISNSLNRLLMRREDRFLAVKRNVELENGALRFRIQSREVIGGLNFVTDVSIPTLKLDLWINGKALIEEIDYQVKWPDVIVTNGKFVNAVGNNVLVIRAYGLSNTGVYRDIPQEKGYVAYGTLSRNQRYDLHEGRLLHIVVGGATRRRQDIRMEEGSDVLSVNDSENGKPYLLAEIMPVLGDYSSVKTMDLRDMDMQDEEEIKTYLTHKLPETPTDQPSFKDARWPLVSVYISVILQEMLNGSIAASFVNSNPSTMQIVQELEEYEELLYFDPTQDFNDFDDNFIQILAHYSDTPIPITFQQYQLLDRVNNHFLFGRVDLSRSYTIA